MKKIHKSIIEFGCFQCVTHHSHIFDAENVAVPFTYLLRPLSFNHFYAYLFVLPCISLCTGFSKMQIVASNERHLFSLVHFPFRSNCRLMDFRVGFFFTHFGKWFNTPISWVIRYACSPIIRISISFVRPCTHTFYTEFSLWLVY